MKLAMIRLVRARTSLGSKLIVTVLLDCGVVWSLSAEAVLEIEPLLKSLSITV